MRCLILFALLAACSRTPEDPATQVKATLAAIEKAAEDRDIDAVLEHLAEGFKDDRGRGPSSIRSMLQLHFMRQGSIHALVRISELTFPNKDTAEATLNVAVAGTPLPEEGPLDGLRADWVEVKLRLVRDDGDWKVQHGSWARGQLFE